MADDDEKSAEQSNLSNQISEHTGQFDARFILWRTFCAENNVAVDSLPSELSGTVREKWEQLKDRELKGPAEEEKK